MESELSLRFSRVSSQSSIRSSCYDLGETEDTLSNVSRVPHFHSFSSGSSHQLGSLTCNSQKLSFVPLIYPSSTQFSLYKPDFLVMNEIFTSQIEKLVLSRKNTSFLNVVIQADNAASNSIMNHTYTELTVYCTNLSVHEFHFKRDTRNEETDRFTRNNIRQFLKHLIRNIFLVSIPSPRLSLTSVKDGSILNRVTILSKNLWTSWMNTSAGVGSVLNTINSRFTEPFNAFPSYFLTPRGWYEKEFTHFTQIVQRYRPPVFCCSHPHSNIQILRSSAFLPGIDMEENLRVLTVCVRAASGQFDGDLAIIDLNKLLPTLQSVSESKERLAAMCQPESPEIFEDSDNSWFKRLADTRWFEIISVVLSVTAKLLDSLEGTSFNVESVNKVNTPPCGLLLMEHNGGQDWCCVITSLIQICLFPVCRTREGFEDLVQRDWIQMGHNFPLRNKSDSKAEGCPLFTLFLDCVSQLWNQKPTEFSFSQEYLVFLLDASQMPGFIEFTFGSEVERATCADERRVISVWNWTQHLSADAVKLFDNPVHHLYILLNSILDCKINDIPTLKPIFFVSRLQFWRLAYLRWIDFLAINGGGSPQTVFCYHQLLNTISTYLQATTETANDEVLLRKISASVPKSLLTSTFPFSFHSPTQIVYNSELIIV